jgi:hypothetical protein
MKGSGRSKKRVISVSVFCLFTLSTGIVRTLSPAIVAGLYVGIVVLLEGGEIYNLFPFPPSLPVHLSRAIRVDTLVQHKDKNYSVVPRREA